MDNSFSIRINTLLTTRKEVEELLKGSGIAFQNVEWCDEALVIEGASKKDFTEHPLVTGGKVYIQNQLSLLPGMVMQPKEGSKILDMCAAPGGKTLHLAQLMNDKGEIIANDISKDRLYKMKAQLLRAQARCISLSLKSGTHVAKLYPEHFDYVLVDVPCTMDQPLSPKRIKMQADIQLKLLLAGVRALKPEGELVYATCTSTVTENEEVVKRALKKIPELKHLRITIEKLPLSWLSEEGNLRINKDEKMGSFFVSRFRKNNV